jgi:hypothetical protein
MKKTISITLLSLVAGLNVAHANSAKMLPKATEVWSPVPAVVTPGKIPSDAISLFNGVDLDAWVDKRGKAPKWEVDNGILTVIPKKGRIQTKQNFCDMQLHVEWRSPAKVKGKRAQDLGNSGIRIQGLYEVQILDSYDSPTYVNGQAASVYKQISPLVNATAPTGEWNSYDIIYKAPVFNDDKSLKTPAYLTLLHNGILVQNHVELKGKTMFRGLPAYKAHGCAPIYLQEHASKVSFRNIWVREL